MSFPAIILEWRGDDSITGWWALFLGWFLIFGGDPAGLAWFANPMLWLAWVLVLKGFYRAGIMLGILAFSVGLLTFTLKNLVLLTAYNPVKGMGLGGYLWLASMVVVVIGGPLEFSSGVF